VFVRAKESKRMSNSSGKLGFHNTHGAIVRLFGVILIILWALNTMLSWRGGFAVMSLPVILFVVGFALCVIGSILRDIHE